MKTLSVSVLTAALLASSTLATGAWAQPPGAFAPRSADQETRRGEVSPDAGPPPLPPGMGPPPGGMPPGAPGANVKYATVVHVIDGAYQAAQSIPSDLSAGSLSDTVGKGVRIVSSQPNLNGVLVQGGRSAYTLKAADLQMSGIGTSDFEGIGAGAMVTGGVLVLDKVKIEMGGAVRSATVANDHAILKVYDSLLIAHGGPLPTGYVHKIGPGMMEAPAPLGITGTARTTLTMGQSESYFYRSKIIADGWGALSTDATGGYVYLEANDCDVEVRNSGYGAYADGGAHVAVNSSRMTVATYGGIIAGPGEIRFKDVQGASGRDVAMIHSVMGSPSEVGKLSITGGSFASAQAAVLVKSANADIVLDGAKLQPADGVLVRAIVNDDANRTKANGQPVAGVDVKLRHGGFDGDLTDQDTERGMTIALTAATLKGGVERATISLDAQSHWLATKDSSVVLASADDVSRLDAAPGVTISARMASGPAVQAHRLPGGGRIVPAS